MKYKIIDICDDAWEFGNVFSTNVVDGVVVLADNDGEVIFLIPTRQVKVMIRVKG